MKTLAILTAAITALATPTVAGDKFSGYYNRECSDRHMCDLRIDQTGPTSWHVLWEPFVWRGDGKPICRKEFTVQIGGPAGTFVRGIAHGRVGGGLVGIVDRGEGRLEVRAAGQGSAGEGMEGVYEAVGE